MEKKLTLEEKESEYKLNQLYKNLEEDWDYIKQSKLRTRRRCSTDTGMMVKTLSLLENSPRTLMSSLQHRRSPTDEMAWKVRTNDLAVMEILRERRGAIESGKLKGRRLFDEVEDVSEVCFRGWNGLIEDFEVRSVSSYDLDDEEEIGASDEDLPVCSLCGFYSSFGSTSLCNDQNVLKEGEKVVAVEVEHKRGFVSGGRMKLLLVWLAVAALIVNAVGRFSGYKNEDHHEVIFFPT